MRILPRILPLKIIAVILFIASFGCAIAFGAGFAYAVTGGYFEYPQAEDYLHSEQLKNETDDALKSAAEAEPDTEAFRNAVKGTNFVFTLVSDGVTVFRSSDAPTYPETHTEFPLPDAMCFPQSLCKARRCAITYITTITSTISCTAHGTDSASSRYPALRLRCFSAIS